jgi:DNA-binding MarR family transcriptional regulator
MSSDHPANNRGPMIGSLVRMAHSAMIQDYSRWLANSSYKDIQPAHAAAIQPLWENPEGVRLTTLAQTARITKQSMGALIDSLESNGYVERIEDDDDRRASRIRLTAKGRKFARDVRTFARDVEKRLAEQIGERRLENLREALQLIIATTRNDG